MFHFFHGNSGYSNTVPSGILMKSVVLGRLFNKLLWQLVTIILAYQGCWFQGFHFVLLGSNFFFSNVATFDCNDSTIALNSVTLLVVLLSFLGVSGLFLVLLPLVISLNFWYFSLLLFLFVCCFSSCYIISDFE